MVEIWNNSLMRNIDMNPSTHISNLTPKTPAHSKVRLALASLLLYPPYLTHHNTDPNPNEAEQKAAAEKRERGEKTAENIRYGEAISEHGMGGETVGNSRGVNPSGGEESVEEKGDKARHAQGYGPGSGVGA
jgi:hypothetical protein